MTKGYEKLLASCQSYVAPLSCHYILSMPARLSELLYLPMPELPTSSQKSDSIQIGSNTSNQFSTDDSEDMIISGGKWEDEEERRFFEDVQDLKDFVPKSVLGLDDVETTKEIDAKDRTEEEDKTDIRKLEEELERLAEGHVEPSSLSVEDEDDEEDGYAFKVTRHFYMRF